MELLVLGFYFNIFGAKRWFLSFFLAPYNICYLLFIMLQVLC